MAIALAPALIAPGAAASGNPAPGAVLDPGFGDGGVVRFPAEDAFTPTAPPPERKGSWSAGATASRSSTAADTSTEASALAAP